MSQAVSGPRHARMGDEAGEPLSSRFGRIAVRNGLVTEADLRRCVAVQRQIEASGRIPPDISDVLVHQGYLSPEAAQKILQRQGRTEIEGYVLSDQLGRGTTGAVYRAAMTSMNRTVAVRILDPELEKDSAYRTRFLREARTAAWLNHQNVVSGVDVGESNGHCYFVMDYVEGTSIADLLASEGPLGEKRAMGIALMVARALEHAHQHGILHRDLKPRSIVVLPDGTARVLGLGVARRPWKCGRAMVTGTPGYVAPEVIRGMRDADVRADIYSLGACLYEMLTGHPPFEGELPHVLRHHLNSVPVDPRRYVPSLTKSASDLVMEMMAKDRDARPSDPRDLAIAIEGALLDPKEHTDAIIREEVSAEIPLLAPIPDPPAPRRAPVIVKKKAPMKLVENAPVSLRGGRSGRVGATSGRRKRVRRRR